MKLNEQQRLAVETIDRNVALVAGAGTGKTGVLTERFIEILKNGSLPEGKQLRSVVAITFTEKAAEEMKARIQKRLSEERDRLPGLAGQTNFRIATIHGFCAQILRDDPAGASVDPQFVILEEADAQALMLEALHESYRGREPDRYDAVILSQQWHEHGDFLSNVLALDGQLRADNASLEQVKEASFCTQELTETADEALHEALTTALSGARTNTKLYKFFADDTEKERLHGDICTRNALYHELLVQEICTGKTMADLQILLLDYCARTQTAMNDAYEFVFALLADARLRYAAKKQAIRALDYDDLQEKVLARLQDEPTRKTLQEEICYLMIDECQDINELQAEIFTALCTREKKLDRNNLFIVGDPRQSIYGFRYARAELFEQLQTDIEESGGLRIQMHRNYRCSARIIDYVNGVFRKHFQGLEELEAAGTHKSVCIEWCAPEEGEEPGVAADAARVRDQILALRADGVRWDEIGLLFRSAAPMQRYEDTLKAAGIPSVNLSSRSFWNRQEVLDLLAAALVMTDQADDRWWLAYLRSPLAGMADRTLLQYKGAGAHWEERLMAKKYDDPQAESVLAEVREGRKILQTSALPALIRRIRRDYDVFCASQTDAERRLANLDQLSDWLQARWEQGNASADELATQWLDRTGAEAEEGEQAEAEEGRVSLLTIHKAKGLEKRVIFLVGVDAAPNHQTSAFLYEEAQAHLRGSASYELARERRKERERNEELRILYVALTRAKESLYLTSHTGKEQNFLQMLVESGHDPRVFPKPNRHGLRTPGESVQKHPTKTPSVPDLPVKRQYGSFSASQLMVFLQCKREWYLRHRVGIREEDASFLKETDDAHASGFGLSGVQKGSLLHEIVEKDDGRPIPVLIEEAASSTNESIRAAEKKQLADWVGRVRAHSFRGPVRHELRFDWERNGVFWTGSIDLVEEAEPVCLYDFKTNKPGTDLLETYATQMQFYALAYRTLTGKVPEAVLWWLTEDRIIPVDCSYTALEQLEHTMDDFETHVLTRDAISDYPCASTCPAHCRMQAFCRQIR